MLLVIYLRCLSNLIKIYQRSLLFCFIVGTNKTLARYRIINFFSRLSTLHMHFIVTLLIHTISSLDLTEKEVVRVPHLIEKMTKKVRVDQDHVTGNIENAPVAVIDAHGVGNASDHDQETGVGVGRGTEEEAGLETVKRG